MACVLKWLSGGLRKAPSLDSRPLCPGKAGEDPAEEAIAGEEPEWQPNEPSAFGGHTLNPKPYYYKSL